MYGGHIVEDWDRRLANAYLFKYFNEGLMEGMEMFPGFMAPANSLNHKQVCLACRSRHARSSDNAILCFLMCTTVPVVQDNDHVCQA